MFGDFFLPYKEESGKEALDEMVETFDWQQMLGLVFWNHKCPIQMTRIIKKTL